MDLNDILDNHVVAHRVQNLNKIGSFYNLFKTYDGWTWPAYLYDYTTYQMMFSFLGEMSTPSSEQSLLRMHFYFSTQVRVGAAGTPGDYFRCEARISTTQADPDKVRMRCVAGTAYNYNYSSYFILDLRKNYAMTYRFRRASSATCTVYTDIYEWDVDGNKTLVAGSSTSCTLYGGVSTYSYLIVSFYRNHTFDGFVYEPDFDSYLNGLSGKKPRIFVNVGRTLDFTYYSTASSIHLVLPQSPLFDGSAYDRTQVLNDRIDALEEELAAVKIGGQIYTNISTLFTKISDGVFDLDSDKLDHLKEILSDPMGAIKANMYRLIKIGVEKFRGED